MLPGGAARVQSMLLEAIAIFRHLHLGRYDNSHATEVLRRSPNSSQNNNTGCGQVCTAYRSYIPNRLYVCICALYYSKEYFPRPVVLGNMPTRPNRKIIRLQLVATRLSPNLREKTDTKSVDLAKSSQGSPSYRQLRLRDSRSSMESFECSAARSNS
ncbi:hypothetical protein BC629DRAFT_21901 [Irpex lacteus]|nr:hypothetical protein BC629DRAFT_21901 [Irpex lacteus]